MRVIYPCFACSHSAISARTGPYKLANPLPVTHPESEDAFVFRTKRGYHLLTNVNNDHARCGAGVACGGHAVSTPAICRCGGWVYVAVTLLCAHHPPLQLLVTSRAVLTDCFCSQWGTDGLHFSNLTIGAFGPAIGFSNGSVWKNAYVERPQVLLNTTSGEPQTFFAGLGRSSYDDSVTWAAPFCTDDDKPGACGPTGTALGPWTPPAPCK